MQRVKEAKKRFVACDDEWRAALKKAHSVRTNTHTGKVLVADRGFVSTKLAFELARLGLVGAINELEAGAQAALLEALARTAAAQLAYHEAAAERLRAAQAALGEAAAAREATREAAAEERAAHTATREHLLQLQRDHLGGKEDGAGGAAAAGGAGGAAAVGVRPGGGASASVGEGSTSSATSATGRGPTQKEGFLFIKDRKKTSKALIHGSPTWRRVWFRLEQGKLLYRAKGKDGRGLSSLKAVGAHAEIDEVQEVVNLLICTVQVASTLASYHPIAQGVVTLLLCTRVVQVRSGEHGKRWCFDVVSPYRSYTLQARHLAT